MASRTSNPRSIYPSPSPDPTLAPIEHPLLVVPFRTEEEVFLFTNAHPLWQPPPGRGVFGGILLGQSLSAAQQTVQSPLAVHYMSCSFLAAFDASQPLIYHVQRLSDGKSFASRLVQAKHNDRTVSTAICGFTIPTKTDVKSMIHQSQVPNLDVLEPPIEHESDQTNDSLFISEIIKPGFLYHKGSSTTRADINPFRWHPLQSPSTESPPHKRLHIWTRARGHMSKSRNAHLAALAFLTDSWFLAGMYELNPSITGPQGENIGFMVSMNHTIWFHDPEIRADDWMLVERGSSWAGQERCLMEQRIWSEDGKLMATCSQEGIVRLRRPQENQKIQTEDKSKL